MKFIGKFDRVKLDQVHFRLLVPRENGELGKRAYVISLQTALRSTQHTLILKIAYQLYELDEMILCY